MSNIDPRGDSRAFDGASKMSECCQATPHKDLIRRLMDSRSPKSESEWAAAREISELREKLRLTKKYLREANRGCERNAIALEMQVRRNIQLK